MAPTAKSLTLTRKVGVAPFTPITYLPVASSARWRFSVAACMIRLIVDPVSTSIVAGAPLIDPSISGRLLAPESVIGRSAMGV
jgi:hypothetical protein